jgi:hypothetical protein
MHAPHTSRRRADAAAAPRSSAEGIPAGAGAEEVSIVWERHDKLSLTQAERVAADGSASFREIMRQTATLRRSGHSFDPKDYSFKLQAVSYTAKGHEKRRTVSRGLDLAHHLLLPPPQSGGQARRALARAWEPSATPWATPGGSPPPPPPCCARSCPKPSWT